MLALEHEGHCKAYPIKIISEHRVINDSFAGLDLLVTFGPPSELGMMFKRELDGRLLTFESVPTSEHEVALMKDLETGSTWEALTGVAISGPSMEKELERLSPEYSFWFAWNQLHPETAIYQLD